jgi:hypothetical protein
MQEKILVILKEEEQTPRCPSSDVELASEEETSDQVAKELEKQQDMQIQEQKNKKKNKKIKK